MKLRLCATVFGSMMFATQAANADALATVQADGPGTYAMAVRNVSVSMVITEPVDGIFTATITVSQDGIPVLSLTKPELYSIIFGPHLRIVEMDSANKTPEIFITSYTGGAHCCNEAEILSNTSSGWKVIDAGQYDGDPEGVYPQDIDGDGDAEISTYDNRFLYEFTSYAGSYAPRQILALSDDELDDVTADPAYEYQLRQSLDDMGEIPESGSERNSWLATYAATLILLGQDDPLDFAIGNADPSANWGMVRCSVEMSEGQCPEGKETNIGFEAALRSFLADNGYLETKN